jgi:hypothetical protein
MPETLTATRDEKVEDYIHLCATHMFLERIQMFFPKAVRDEFDELDLDSLPFMKDADRLLSELWPNDSDLAGPEYRIASEREDKLVVKYLTEFGQLVNDYLLREIEEVASLPVRPSDA